MKIENVGIVGTGLIGASWAAFYAAKGFGVKLFDADAAGCRAGREQAVGYLRFLQAHGALSAEACESALTAMTCVNGVAELEGVALVQESVAERYEVKKTVFAALEDFTDEDCIFASSSSGLLVTEMQREMKHPERLLIAHPFNPPHLIPLVELVPGEQTNPEHIAFMVDFFAALGKAPVVLKKEVPGHIANRLQAALWREAIQLVLDGVASVADVDKALCTGPGLRWALMGQHMIFHLGGGAQGGIGHFVDHIGVSFEKLWEDMARWDHLPAETKEQLSAGVAEEMHGRSIEEVAAWRDEKLAGMLTLIEAS